MRFPKVSIRTGLAAVGAGVVSGLFGVGGGIVLVPLLVMAAGRGQREAQALSLAAMVPISALGAASYAFSGRVDYSLGIALAAGGLIGVYWGTGLMARTSDRVLRVMFGVVLLIVSVLMVTL
jgi:uncharacterized membrane protein YfcA